MIDFDKELKSFEEKPLMKDSEQKIKEEKLYDMVDLLKTVDSRNNNTGNFGA